MMARFTIIYDWAPDWDPGYGWEDSDNYGETNLTEEFEGTWDELQEYLVQMRINGCYHIDVHEHEEEDEYPGMESCYF